MAPNCHKNICFFDIPFSSNKMYCKTMSFEAKGLEAF